MGTEFPHMLSVREVADLLRVKDLDTAMRWLRQKNIAIHSMGRTKKVFACEVAVVLHLLLAQGLRRKYPTTWERIYRFVAKDIDICEVVIAELKDDHMPKALNKVKPLTESDKKLLNKLKT